MKKLVFAPESNVYASKGVQDMFSDIEWNFDSSENKVVEEKPKEENPKKNSTVIDTIKHGKVEVEVDEDEELCDENGNAVDNDYDSDDVEDYIEDIEETKTDKDLVVENGVATKQNDNTNNVKQVNNITPISGCNCDACRKARGEKPITLDVEYVFKLISSKEVNVFFNKPQNQFKPLKRLPILSELSAKDFPLVIYDFDPCSELALFYVLEYLVRDRKRTELQWLFNKVMLRQHIYFAYYGVYACVRELRHFNGKASSNMANEKPIYDLIGKLNSTKIYGCSQNRPDNLSFNNIDDILECSMLEVNNIVPILSNPLNSLKVIHSLFSINGWGASFGGKNWAKVTKHVMRCFDDSMSPMSPVSQIDKFWGLRHNNGTWFNKTFYNCVYSGCLNQLLEFRRNGKIDLLLSIASKVEPCLGRYRRYAPFTDIKNENGSNNESSNEYLFSKLIKRLSETYYNNNSIINSPTFLGVMECAKNYDNNRIVSELNYQKENNLKGADLEAVLTPSDCYTLNLENLVFNNVVNTDFRIPEIKKIKAIDTQKGKYHSFCGIQKSITKSEMLDINPTVTSYFEIDGF